uniref:Proprotein convertase subtilisin/kexin type 5-like n=1 Tax=Xiphophorus maculatus TaxID=8083 RepID=M4AMZ7_XIPMA
GTFMDLPNGLKRCNPCSTCDSGAGLKVKRQCEITTDTVCEPMEGFYCTDLKSGGCSVAQKHRSCEPGHYISRMGYRVKTDCTEFRSTICQSCSDGTYMDLPNGLKRCNPCSNCDSAGLKEKQQCVITADTVCEPMEGFYCTDLKSGGCSVAQKHRSCEPGHYISRNGTASTDTECSECSSGSFSDGTMLSCQPHTQCEKENLHLIKAGTASTDAECGGKSYTTTGIVIGVLFLVIFLLVAAAIVVVLWKTKKIKIPSELEKNCS